MCECVSVVYMHIFTFTTLKWLKDRFLHVNNVNKMEHGKLLGNMC